MNESFAKSLILTVPKWIQNNTLQKNEITFSIYPEFLIPFFHFYEIIHKLNIKFL